MARRSRFTRLRAARRDKSIAPPISPGGKTPVRTIKIAIRCPECGGPGELGETDSYTHCGYCGSLLAVAFGEGARYYRMVHVCREPAELVQIVIRERLAAKRAEILGRRSQDRNDRNEGLFLDPSTSLNIVERLELERYEGMLRESSSVENAVLFFAPYWHVDRLLGSVALARSRRTADKALRAAVSRWEATVAAYDPGFDMRDGDLRINSARVELLTRGMDTGELRYLGVQRGEDEALSSIPYPAFSMNGSGEWEPGTTWLVRLPMTIRLVYKPYWLATVRCFHVRETLLFDASYRRVVGHPSPRERKAILEAISGTPLYPEESPSVAIAASECPVCGAEMPRAPRLRLLFCRNCHRVIRPASHDPLRYQIPDPLPQAISRAIWLPFYRIHVTYRLGDDEMSLARLRRLVDNEAPETSALEDEFFIPAYLPLAADGFEGQIYRNLAWSQCIARAGIATVPGKIPLGSAPDIRDVLLSEEEAAELCPVALFALSRRMARLSSGQATRLLDPAGLQTGEGKLFWLPFRSGPDGLVPLLDIPKPRGLGVV